MSPSGSSSTRVLIVEDSILTAQQLCDLITTTHRGTECSIAATESAALEKLASMSFRIVVIDLALREGTGFGVLRQVALQRPKPLAIVITNYALPNYRDFAMLSGADYFLDKAMTMEELPKLLASHLS